MGFLDAHLLRNGHRYEPGDGRIRKQTGNPVHVRRQRIQKHIAFILDIGFSGGPCLHEPVFLLHEIQKLDPFFHLGRQAQHPQGMTRGCGVENEQIAGIGLENGCHFHDGHHLIHSRQGKIEEIGDIGLIEISTPIRQGGQNVPVLFLERRQEPSGIQLQREQIGGLFPIRTPFQGAVVSTQFPVHRCQGIPNRHPQTVGQRMGRICRNDENSLVPGMFSGQIQGHGR